MLHFETAPESNIKTAEDAMWWAITTITTVGYGDRYPVTSEGRFVAGLLMAAGVGLFGSFSGFLAAWFMGSEPPADRPAAGTEVDDLRGEIVAMRQVLARMEDRGAR